MSWAFIRACYLYNYRLFASEARTSLYPIRIHVTLHPGVSRIFAATQKSSLLYHHHTVGSSSLTYRYAYTGHTLMRDFFSNHSSSSIFVLLEFHAFCILCPTMSQTQVIRVYGISSTLCRPLLAFYLWHVFGPYFPLNNLFTPPSPPRPGLTPIEGRNKWTKIRIARGPTTDCLLVPRMGSLV